MGIVVEKPGILTTIQDEGRFGYQEYGVTPSGPMDTYSFHIANLLAGNHRNEPALEVTLIGPKLKFTESNVIAIAGADFSPTLNGQPFPMLQAVVVQRGDILELHSAKSGCRAYIAFAGGLDVPRIMGSCATALQNQLGGMEGRKLKQGDQIAFCAPCTYVPKVRPEKVLSMPALGHDYTVRVILGPQEEKFTQSGIQTFLTSPYTVTKDFDRMGCRLEGSSIEHKNDGNIISDGMVTGAIQVPPAGQPIIMMAERQTTGGYTKIGTVISVDLPIIGQCKAGDVLRFQAVSLQQAQQWYKDMICALDRMEETIQSEKGQLSHKFRQHYHVIVDGKAYQVELELAN